MSVVSKWRKKPVVVEVMRFLGTPESAKQIIDWALKSPIKIGASIRYWCSGEEDHDANLHVLHIDTIEGTMVAVPGDFVIKGVKGEFYPCRPDIFMDTYELVEGIE